MAAPMDLLDPLLDQSLAHPDAYFSESEDFDLSFDAFLDDFLRVRDEKDEYITPEGNPSQRLLRRTEACSAQQVLSKKQGHLDAKRIMSRRLALDARLSSRRSLRPLALSPTVSTDSLLESNRPKHRPLRTDAPDIQTTAYKNSFASRLYGFTRSLAHSSRDVVDDPPGTLIYLDWETDSPWLKLMKDIRQHYQIKCDLPDDVVEPIEPLAYVCLQQKHVQQVHELLTTAFWPGIDITASLANPRKYTIVATYKLLVVGAAFISPPPDDAYITYIAVKTGWENSGIGLTMLYHLIKSNDTRDITLHVSANSDAMLLYNKIGFKSEGFVVGFYQDYLHPKSQACRNALRLRLRQS